MPPCSPWAVISPETREPCSARNSSVERPGRATSACRPWPELLLRLADPADLGVGGSNASIIFSSGSSPAPASIIVRASFVPTTTRSRLDSCATGSVGLTTKPPSTRPMRTAPTGPMKGSDEIISAAEAPLMARMSCAVTRSAERTVQITCTWLLKPFGRAAGSAVSHTRREDGALRGTSLALEEAAGDLAGGVHALFDVDGEREEVRSLACFWSALGRGQHHRVARADDDGAVGLLGELAGLEDDLLIADVHRDRRRCPRWS